MSSSPPSARDELFVRHAPGPGNFRFDAAVARVLPDMLRRSIPGYATLLELIGILAAQKVQHDTHVYDLGCSLGAVSLAIRHALGSRSATLIAVDQSEAMVERCRETIQADAAALPVEVRQADITELSFEPSSFIVLNFTLQFIPPEQRTPLLEKVAQALLPGGVLVLSEKTRGATPTLDAWHQHLHDAFRQANGYSQLELSRKREALEQVLLPDTTEEQEARLAHVGLTPYRWFQNLQFVSWVAEKPQ